MTTSHFFHESLLCRKVHRPRFLSFRDNPILHSFLESPACRSIETFLLIGSREFSLAMKMIVPFFLPLALVLHCLLIASPHLPLVLRKVSVEVLPQLNGIFFESFQPLPFIDRAAYVMFRLPNVDKLFEVLLLDGHRPFNEKSLTKIERACRWKWFGDGQRDVFSKC